MLKTVLSYYKTYTKQILYGNKGNKLLLRWQKFNKFLIPTASIGFFCLVFTNYQTPTFVGTVLICQFLSKLSQGNSFRPFIFNILAFSLHDWLEKKKNKSVLIMYLARLKTINSSALNKAPLDFFKVSQTNGPKK